MLLFKIKFYSLYNKDYFINSFRISFYIKIPLKIVDKYILNSLRCLYNI